MIKNASKIFRDKFFGAPYKFGGQSKKDGFDCLSLVENYYKELGKEVPDFADLYNIYEKDFVRAKRRMWNRILKNSTEITLNEVLAGDLIIFKHESFGNYPGIWLGNGNVGSVFVDTGVTVVNYMELDVLHVRRWNS